MAKPMKLISTPKVYIVGRQQENESALDSFLNDQKINWQSSSDIPAEALTEAAGRLCYMSYANPRPGGNEAYIDHIKEVGHGSVLEHAVWNLLITGVSRSLTHELVRHRAGMSYSQLSQRYVDESDGEYVIPDIVANDPDLFTLWTQSIDVLHEAYIQLVARIESRLPTKIDPTTRRKMARQTARSVLPNATETKIFVTANARALRHFVELRGSRHAEPEIRKLAVAILDIMQVESWNIFGDYRKVALGDGTFEIVTDTPKV